MKARRLYWFAAILTTIGLLAHEIAGAPMVLPPLSNTDLPQDVIWLHHFSWHVGSVALLAMIGMFIYAAIHPDEKPLAVVATAMSGGFAVLAISLAIIGDGVLWTTPAPYIWAVIAVLGGVGLRVDSDANSGS